MVVCELSVHYLAVPNLAVRDLAVLDLAVLPDSQTERTLPNSQTDLNTGQPDSQTARQPKRTTLPDSQNMQQQWSAQPNNTKPLVRLHTYLVK